ncbi:MAG: hypothetical protein D3924_12605 [Candidatus Electrothrix sp. AR4]|nr:hypothetical protein [Candidatus Electrothrix sp. AR4]
MSGCVQDSKAVWGSVTALQDDLSIWKKTNRYKGMKYPSTKKIIPTFQAEQVPVSCRVFAHLLVHIPEGFSGQTIALAIEKEAMAHGADMLLIGGTRQAEETLGPVFSYYGPTRPYKCRDYWDGWRFGYDEWVEQGEWVSMGYDEWGSKTDSFNTPLLIQAAFLRCLD